ncbi:hypothetical protein FQZ97_1246370 [compost metagenome]
MALSTGVPPPSTNTGASLTGLMVTVTVLVVVPPWPSLTVTVKLSVPLKSAPGVYV